MTGMKATEILMVRKDLLASGLKSALSKKEKGPGTLIRGWKVLPPARVSPTPPLSLLPLNSFQ
jgi:hypothetical protein